MANRIKLLSAVIICTGIITAAGSQPVLPQCPGDDYPCISALLAKYSDGAGIPVADTLYRALDSAGRLNAHDLLRYARVKALLGGYRAAAALFCRAAADTAGIEYAAVTQMGQLFADADLSDKAAALADFEGCALSRPSVDTAFIRNRLADIYGRGGLFEREIDVLARLDIPAAPVGRRLFDIARAHFAYRRYRYAAAAAAAAHGRIEDPGMRSNMAIVAYQSYAGLGMRDSALVWLRASGVTSRDALVQAAALYQETGLMAEAAALIDSLPVSPAKDTLSVRQYLFAGEPGKALELITASRRHEWALNPRDRMLWRVRCMAFNGRLYEAAPVLDSIRFAPNWGGAAETLRYRYWIQRFGDDDQRALETFGRLEYSIYRGGLTAGMELLRGQGRGLAGEAVEMLTVRLARALSEAARHQEALEALDLAGGGRSPEYLYFRAEMLSAAGRREEARAAANKILTDFPGDIFAQKARILLTRI